MRATPIRTGIDYERPGVQHDFLKLAHSRDDSAWGSIRLPITVISHGTGPTALLTGGNHGDEYEGPVALSKLSLSLQPEAVQGRVIIVPFMNYPAFLAARRTSPIDNGNMNRIFPGRPDGTISEKIADYFQRYLLPQADYVLDIHSGGKTLDFVPFAAAHVLADKDQQQRCVAAMQAFAAPYGLMMVEQEAYGLYDTAAEEQGKVFVSTELGGGGTSTARSVAVADRGVHNFLVHAGIKQADLISGESIMLDLTDERGFITCEQTGLLEMCVDLGAKVREDTLIARVYDITRTGFAAKEYHSPVSGILAGRHHPGLIKPGDCLAAIAGMG